MSHKIDIKIYEPYKHQIIKMYQQAVSPKLIMEKYNINQKHLYECLDLWGVKLHRVHLHKGLRKDKVRVYHKPKPMKVSKELLAMRKINQKINNDHIKYVKFVRASSDQMLIHNIINHPIIG